MNNLPKIFVMTEDSKGVGFTFLQDKKAVHNYIHPECLKFYWAFFENGISLEDKEAVSPDDSIAPVRLASKNLPSIDEERKIVKCHDGRFRRCDIVSFRFVADGKLYNELFVVDKSLRVAGVLGKNFKLKI